MKKWITLAISLFATGAALIIIAGQLGDSLFWGYRDMLLLGAGMFIGGAAHPIMMILSLTQCQEGKEDTAMDEGHTFIERRKGQNHS